MTLREQYMAEEKAGVKPDVDVYTYTVRKLDEDFSQEYTDEGVPFVTNDDGWEAEDWEGVV